MTESNTLEEIEATFFYDTPTTGVLRIYWRRLVLLVCSYTDHAGICPGIEPEAEWYRNLWGSDKTGDVAQSGARAIGGAELVGHVTLTGCRSCQPLFRS